MENYAKNFDEALNGFNLNIIESRLRSNKSSNLDLDDIKGNNSKFREFIRQVAKDHGLTFSQVLKIYNQHGFSNFYTQVVLFKNKLKF